MEAWGPLRRSLEGGPTRLLSGGRLEPQIASRVSQQGTQSHPKFRGPRGRGQKSHGFQGRNQPAPGGQRPMHVMEDIQEVQD